MHVRAIWPGEVDAFMAATMDAFHGDLGDHQRARWGPTLEAERSLAAFDGERIVGTASAFSRRMGVPGGVVPAAHVTFVGVLPTHRRRGVLRSLLGAVHEAAPEPFAVLWASEATIYGRFGYGLAASHARIEVATARARLRDEAPPAAPVRVVAPREAEDVLRAVHAQVLASTPGMPDRGTDGWWARALQDPEDERAGAASLRAAVLEDGRGYALYAVRTDHEPAGPSGTCVVRELVAVDAAARTALWRFLLSLDLVRTVQWRLAPVDEPLQHALADARALSARPGDALWVALLDVPRALAARTYATPVDLVLDVADVTRVRLRAEADGPASCDDAPHAPADLRIGAEALAAAYLGGTTLAQLHAAGRVDELRPGALAAATRAFRGDREPWCPEVF